MIQKTKNYEQFKFRVDNREKIITYHVERLKESIKSKNLLEFRPIMVNKDYEIMDGQHRLLAAKSLGVDIYFEIVETIKSNDIIALNINKSWSMADFLNYYIKNGFAEYQKLGAFMTKHNISLKVALGVVIGNSKKLTADFKLGKFVLGEDHFEEELDMCWQTIGLIRRIKGYSLYTTSARFWKALLTIVRHGNFNGNKWLENVEKQIEKIGPRVNLEDYYKMMMEIFNWGNRTKIEIK